jgi:hypothetical protein
MSKPQKADDMPILSMCDIMRDNTNNVIMKVEGLVPTYIENLTDLQTEYLRIARDFFGTCYIAENKLFDKMGIDQKSIKGFDNYLKIISKFVAFQIDMTNNLQKTIRENLMSGMKIYDDYVKLMLTSYGRMLEHASSLLPEKEIIDLFGKKPLAILS